jgi:hypothetical protein
VGNSLGEGADARQRDLDVRRLTSIFRATASACRSNLYRRLTGASAMGKRLKQAAMQAAAASTFAGLGRGCRPEP